MPPISVQLELPATYPSADPPSVLLLAPWLSPDQLAVLEAQLHQLWEEQGPGSPICFTWLEWCA